MIDRYLIKYLNITCNDEIMEQFPSILTQLHYSNFILIHNCHMSLIIICINAVYFIPLNIKSFFWLCYSFGFQLYNEFTVRCTLFWTAIGTDKNLLKIRIPQFSRFAQNLSNSCRIRDRYFNWSRIVLFRLVTDSACFK